MGVLRKLVDVEDDEVEDEDVEDVDVEDDEVEDVDVEDVDIEDDEVEDEDADLAGASGVEDEPVLLEDLAGAFGDELTEVWARADFLSAAGLAAALAEVEPLVLFLDLDFGLDCFVV